MASHDPKNDVTPVNVQKPPSLPTVAALTAAIAGSGVAASYPAAARLTMSRNDLIFVCKTHGITVAGL